MSDSDDLTVKRLKELVVELDRASDARKSAIAQMAKARKQAAIAKSVESGRRQPRKRR